MNDLFQIPLRHDPSLNNLPNFPSDSAPRNDPIIPANDSSWPPNISYCTMGGERAFHQYNDVHELFHNAPGTRAVQPIRPSYSHSSRKLATDRANETKLNDPTCEPATDRAKKEKLDAKPLI